jgi:hypothetical protein
MTTKIGLLLCAVLLLTAPTWAQSTTYWGGFEDLAGNSDYDYNDLVFSMTGPSLKLISSGTWYSEPTLIPGSYTGAPFWNNSSGDGPNDNVGYCIYGGGNCNSGVGLAPGDDYLATSTGGSVNDVSFSVAGDVSETIKLYIAGDADSLGWYLLSDPSSIHALNSSSSQGAVTFTPGGNFAIVGENNSTGINFTSDNVGAGSGYNTDNGINHLAWFGPNSVPEPGSIMLLLVVLLGVLPALRRRKIA